MISATKFVVKGVVQGVGFRYFVERLALRLDIDGYVRNLMDKSVEVIAHSTNENLLLLEKALWKGPTYSRVDSVTKEIIEIELKGKGFNINF